MHCMQQLHKLHNIVMGCDEVDLDIVHCVMCKQTLRRRSLQAGSTK